MQIYLILFFLITSYNCFASQDKFYLNKLNYCKITPTKYNDYEPAIFPSNNDLLRADFNKKRISKGEKIVIRGIVLDENCAPVQDAKVFLWQVGADGKYHYKTLKNKLSESLINDDSHESNFIGAGSAITNNQGEFYFITLKPKSSRLYIRVTHKNLQGLDTTLTLSQNAIAKNPIEIRKDFIPIVESSILYDFQIVLKGDSILKY